MKFTARHAHYAVSVLLILVLIPAFRAAHLPLHFSWNLYFTYWAALTFESVMAALFIYAVGFPSEFWSKLRHRGPRVSPWPALAAIFVPSTYVFLVMVLVFGYNDVIASLRFTGAADRSLEALDSRIFGMPAAAAVHVPLGLLHALEWVYVAMFAMVGGCLLVLALREGLAASMKLAAMIATSYYIALVLFYFIPATGPYFLSGPAGGSNHVGLGQRAFAVILGNFAAHKLPGIIGTEYFIAVPCMHLVKPLLAVWCVRKWKRVAALSSVYCIALIPTVILLQQHYVIDVIAAFPVAALVIALVDAPRVRLASASASEPIHSSEAIETEFSR